MEFSKKTKLALLAAGLTIATALFAQTGQDTQVGPTGSSGVQGDIMRPDAQQNTAPVELIDPGRIYNAKKPTDWVGKSVVLRNVTVQDTNDGGTFWVGADGDHRLLVVRAPDANLSAMRLHKGDIVVVSGTIHPASRYMAEQTSAKKGAVKDAEKSSGVVLLAEDISISSSTQH